MFSKIKHNIVTWNSVIENLYQVFKNYQNCQGYPSCLRKKREAFQHKYQPVFQSTESKVIGIKWRANLNSLT